MPFPINLTSPFHTPQKKKLYAANFYLLLTVAKIRALLSLSTTTIQCSIAALKLYMAYPQWSKMINVLRNDIF